MRKPRVRSPFFLPALEARTPAVWQPQVDIYHAREGWVVKMDLAGVRPQDVSITVRGSQLRVSGVRHDRIVEEGWSYYAMEIAYNPTLSRCSSRKNYIPSLDCLITSTRCS